MKFLLFLAIFVLVGTCPAQDALLYLISKPQPPYTHQGRENGTVGEVTLKVQFLENGTIGEIIVVSSLPDGLTEQAVAAARKIQFIPKKVNGMPVSVIRTVVYGFDIWFREDDPEIKGKVKIIKKPIFAFPEAKALGRRKLFVYLSRSGTAGLKEITPDIPAGLVKKFEEAIRGIVFEPATLSNGQKVSVEKIFNIN